MEASPKPTSKGTARAAQTQPRRHSPAPQLDAAMACDAAFRIVAGHYLRNLTAHHRATCKGDADALHEMRISLTRLRTAIVFFSPMVASPQQARLADELKWLNAQMGVVRDLDVAIGRLKEINKERPRADYRSWIQKRADSQRHLARALRSARYRRLIESISHWIEAGDWSRQPGLPAAKRRACLVTEYSARKLLRWQEKLVAKSRKLRDIGAKKRHRLRLMNKRLTYAVEAVAELVSDSEASRQQAMLKVLRKAQRSLGQLNDDESCRVLAATLGLGGEGAAHLLLGPKREKHMMRAAAAAYEKLGEMKPLRI